jgi:CRISPR/Cas system-associated exonuclease Cas4 (RecB family)
MSSKDRIAPVKWSYSAAQQHDSCPRKLFYQHQIRQVNSVQTAEQTETSDNDAGSLIGSAVHEAIATEIERWAHGHSVSLTSAKRTAKARLSTQVIEDTAEFSSMVQTTSNHLDRMFSDIWPRYSSLTYICHERLGILSFSPGEAVVRPDFCTRDADGSLIITDWKTSQPAVIEDPTQLEVYALWAHRRFEPDPDRISAEFAYCGTGEVRPVPIDAGVLDSTAEMIRSDLNEWNKTIVEEAFPTDPDPMKCEKCSYSYICPQSWD